MKYLPLILAALVIAILSYHNEKLVKKYKEEEQKKELQKNLKVDLKIEPIEIKEIKKEKIDKKN